MSIYGLGFFAAVIMYFVYLNQTKKKITNMRIITMILLALLSWLGFVGILFVVTMNMEDKKEVNK